MISSLSLFTQIRIREKGDGGGAAAAAGGGERGERKLKQYGKEIRKVGVQAVWGIANSLVLG